MDIIKNYIKSCKDVRNLIRKSQGMTKISEEERVKRSISFQVDNVYRSIEDLHAEIQTDLKAATDAEISKRKNEIADLRKRMDNISSNVKDILSDLNDEPQVVQINKRYDKLYSEFHSYCTKIISEFDVRDIEKEKLFKESHLNIKLSKFKGHDSVDIYSFQRDFERLHLRETPAHPLPDLLKNNFLDDPVLSLVKNLDDINEIWNRVKLTYGNPKNLLERKLDELSNIQQIFRAKDPEKIIDGLSKIITVMKDLMILSKHHNIEGKLYHGNGIERIYRLLGDGRVTRWLTLSCEEELEGEQLWKRLLSYLEKDMKIQQQRSLIQKIEDPKTKSSKDHSKSDRKQHAHVTNQRSKVSDSYNNATTTQSTCAICGSTDHISTNGPNNSKLIQYFSCEKFVSMSPSERFKELIKKKLCFQCLFPGANHSQGKHSDGRCQRDFVCPHESHDDYPCKMHVLVCDKHKHNPQNQELLEQYKARFILKQKYLPAYSKEIKLVFHSSHRAQSSKNQPQTQNDDSAIYLLQKINVNDQPYLIFFDNGCSDFVVRQDATEKLGSNSKLEFNGPITLGGVGNVTTESAHGIYSVKLPTYNGNQVTFTGVALDEITVTLPTYPLEKVQHDIEAAYKAT